MLLPSFPANTTVTSVKPQWHNQTKERNPRVCQLVKEAMGGRGTRLLKTDAKGHRCHSAAPGGGGPEATLCTGKLRQGFWVLFSSGLKHQLLSFFFFLFEATLSCKEVCFFFNHLVWDESIPVHPYDYISFSHTKKDCWWKSKNPGKRHCHKD